MSKKTGKKIPSDGSNQFTVGGNVTGSNVVVGNSSTVKLRHDHLSSPQSTELLTNLAAVRQLLIGISGSDSQKVDAVVSDAEAELKMPQPDKDVVGKSLQNLLGWAKTTDSFFGIAESLKPHIGSLVAWLGSSWHDLLSLLG